VVSGTAVTAGAIGGLIGWALTRNISGGGSCPTGQNCPPPTHCLITAWLKTQAVAKSNTKAAVEGECVLCTGNTQVATAEELTAVPNNAGKEKCNKCADNAYPDAAGTCAKCPDGQTVKAQNADVVAAGGTFLTADKACAPATKR
jgi:ribosomal protein L37E